MILILKILCILLAIVLGLVLLALLATVPRAGIRLHGKDGKLNIWLRYGRFQLHIFPLPGRKKSPKAPKAPPPKANKPESPYDFSKLDIGDVLCTALDIQDELRDALRIDVLRADVLLATGDAARTGVLLGSAAALLGMISPVLEQNFDIRDYHIAVDGDFQGDKTHWEAEASFSARPIRLLWALAERWHTLKQLYDSIQKTEAK